MAYLKTGSQADADIITSAMIMHVCSTLLPQKKERELLKKAPFSWNRRRVGMGDSSVGELSASRSSSDESDVERADE
eukprot:4675840-Prymnesium_polylepis.2